MRPAAGAGFTLASADTIYDIRNTQGAVGFRKQRSASATNHIPERALPSSGRSAATFSPQGKDFPP